VKSIVKDIMRIIDRKRIRINGPKVYTLEEAPEKWTGASEDLEEVPCNYPPYAGAVVRVGGLKTQE
jgi:hypothetical protein